MKSSFLRRKFRSIFWVATLMMSVEYIVMLTASIIAGRILGEKAFEAISLAQPVIAFVVFFAFLITQGTAMLCSFEIGNGKRATANRLFSQAVILSVSVGVLLTLLFLSFKKPILNMMELSPELYYYVDGYFTCLAYLPVFQLLSTLLCEIMINECALRIMTIAPIIQIISNIVLSIVLCRYMGIRGIAIGTVISNALFILTVSLHFFSKHNKLRFTWYINIKDIWRVARYGVTDSLVYLYLGIFEFAMSVFLIRNFGERFLPVFAIVMFMFLMFISAFEGIAEAMQPLISTYRGENNLIGIRKTVTLAFRAAIAEGLAVMLIMLLLAPHMPRLFGITDAAATGMAVVAIRAFAVGSVFFSVAMMISYYYLYIVKVGLSVFVITPLILVLPLLTSVALGLLVGINGVWVGMPLSMALTVAIEFFILKKLCKGRYFPLLLDGESMKRQRDYDIPASKDMLLELTSLAVSELVRESIDRSRAEEIMSEIERTCLRIIGMNEGKRFYFELFVCLDSGITSSLRDDGILCNVVTRPFKDSEASSNERDDSLKTGETCEYVLTNGSNRIIFKYTP